MRHIYFIFLLIPFVSQAQISQLSESELLDWVNKYHPVARQSQLIDQVGKQKERLARGSFDPILSGQLDQKQYDGKEYYNLLNGGLRIPSWYGVEFKAGYDRNQGTYLNPENNVPDNGLLYAGASINLGQGLFIDKRRATLRQAQLFTKYSSAMQQQILNELYFQAIKSYWKWVDSWNIYQLYEENVALTYERFQGVKQNFIQGDKPAIDTLEAYIAYQNRMVSRNEAFMDYNNLTLELSTFLWTEDAVPLEITPRLTPPDILTIDHPETISESDLQESLVQLDTLHPDLLLYAYKLADLDIKDRLKREYLKPKIKLNYNLLNESLNNESGNPPITSNYKWGMDISFPLFLRKERGELQLNRIKINETQLALKQKNQELNVKVRKYFNEQKFLGDQILLYNDIATNYNSMLEGEKEKFISGESSVFLINSRERKLIEARIKLINLYSKYRIARRGTDYASGKMEF